MGANGRETRTNNFVYVGDRPSRWIGEPAPYASGCFNFNWSSAHIAIKSIDPATRTITQDGKPINRGYSKNGYWFGYNLLCELDNPGEYYIDRAARRLYFWPPSSGADPDAALTVTDNLLFAHCVSNVSFSGIVFETCLSDALTFADCSGVDVVACTIRNAAGKGVKVARGHDVRIRGCDILSERENLYRSGH